MILLPFTLPSVWSGNSGPHITPHSLPIWQSVKELCEVYFVNRQYDNVTLLIEIATHCPRTNSVCQQDISPFINLGADNSTPTDSSPFPTQASLSYHDTCPVYSASVTRLRRRSQIRLGSRKRFCGDRASNAATRPQCPGMSRNVRTFKIFFSHSLLGPAAQMGEVADVLSIFAPI